jgi:uncharacterized membrane protein
MDPVAITIGISWTVSGMLLAALAVPLIRGRVRPNPLYGVRFPQSFRSEESWYAINRFGGRRLAIWSAPMIAAGVLAFFLPLTGNTGLTLTLGLAPLAFVFIPMIETWIFANRREGDASR